MRLRIDAKRGWNPYRYPLCAYVIPAENRFCRAWPAYRLGARLYCGTHAPKVGATEPILRPRRELYRRSLTNQPAHRIDAWFPERRYGEMPTFTGTQSTASGPDLEDGYYDSKIRETETVEGKWGPQVQVQFECIDEVDRDGNPVEFRGWFTIPTDKQGNVQPVRVGKPLGNLFSAALFAGEPYPEGTSLDTDDLIGRIVRVNWGEYTNRDGVKKVGVIAVKASKKNKTPAATGAKAGTLRKRLVDDDDDDDDLDDA